MSQNLPDNQKSDPQAFSRGKAATRRAAVGLAAAVVVATGAAVATYYLSEADAWVGTVNGERIARADFNRALEIRKRQYQQRMSIDFDAPGNRLMLDNLRKDVLEQLIQRAAMLQGAQERKIAVADPEVETRTRSIRTQFPDEATFKKTLEDNGITPDALRAQIRDSLIFEKLQEELTKGATVTIDEARKAYAADPSSHQVPAEVKASHILLKTEKEAKDLLAKLKGGADFAELARRLSEDTGSKAQGGDLGFFGKGRMVPEFEQAAFALRKGELSRPVKTQFGYHVIKVVDRHDMRDKPFEEVRSDLVGKLLTEKREGVFRAWAEKRRAAAVVVIRPRFQAPTPPPVPGGTASIQVAPVPAHGGEATSSSK